MRRIAAVLSALFLLQPALVFAAFSSPSALFYAISKDPAPRTTKGELHGNIDDVWFSLWINGVQHGVDPLTLQSSTKATLDIAYNAGKVRVKFEARMKNGTMWFKLEGIEGEWGDELFGASLNIFQKKWLELSLRDLEPFFTEALKAQDNPEALAFFDEIFNIENTGNQYELTFKREMLQQIMRGSTSPDRFEAKMTVDMNDNDTLRNAIASFSGSDSEIQVSGNMTIQAGGAVNVVTPTDVMTLAELQTLYPFIPNPFATFPTYPTGFPFIEEEDLLPNDDYDYTDYDWEDEEYWEFEEEDSYVPEVGTRPSARSIQEQARKQNLERGN